MVLPSPSSATSTGKSTFTTGVSPSTHPNLIYRVLGRVEIEILQLLGGMPTELLQEGDNHRATVDLSLEIAFNILCPLDKIPKALAAALTLLHGDIRALADHCWEFLLPDSPAYVSPRLSTA
jgi:hypothetical protein